MTNDGSCMSPYRDFDVRSERKMKTTVGRTASFMSTNTSSRQPHYSGGQSLKYTRAISYNRSSNIYYTMNYINTTIWHLDKGNLQEQIST